VTGLSLILGFLALFGKGPLLFYWTPNCPGHITPPVITSQALDSPSACGLHFYICCCVKNDAPKTRILLIALHRSICLALRSGPWFPAVGIVTLSRDQLWLPPLAFRLTIALLLYSFLRTRCPGFRRLNRPLEQSRNEHERLSRAECPWPSLPRTQTPSQWFKEIFSSENEGPAQAWPT
jgi:hypothetical protein